VRRGIIAARTRLAGEKHAIVDGRGKHTSAVRLAWKGIGVGTAREWIDAPAMEMKRLHGAREVAAQRVGENFLKQGLRKAKQIAWLSVGRRAILQGRSQPLWPRARQRNCTSLHHRALHGVAGKLS
jgi:hypothetical protein